MSSTRSDIILETLDRMERKFDKFDEKWEVRVASIETTVKEHSSWIDGIKGRLTVIAGAVGFVASIIGAYIKDAVTKS